MDININEIVKATGGNLNNQSENIKICGICTDSRKVKKDDLFVALVGENFDAHDFLERVSQSLCRNILINENYKINFDCSNMNIITVKDTTKALGDIASYYKLKFDIPYVSVTGSVGKTTTKDMIYSVLSNKFNTLKNEGNFNNHIGLPLSVFNLNKDYECAIFEMGMSNSNEINYLANIVNPNIAVITNIGFSHIENLGSQENILKAKLEIISNFTKDNILIVNGDDKYLKSIRDKMFDFKVKFFGFDVKNDIFCSSYVLLDDAIEFEAVIKGDKHTFKIPSKGKHNIYNAMSAILVGLEMGMDINSIKNGLINFSPSKMRLDICHKDGVIIINDAYNASPDSMKAALDILSEYKTNRKIAVLSDMLELGEYSKSAHEMIGEYAYQRADVLVLVGKESEYIAKGASALNFENVVYLSCNDDVCQYLKQNLRKDDVVLVKGSRGMKLEEIIQAL